MPIGEGTKAVICAENEVPEFAPARLFVEVSDDKIGKAESGEKANLFQEKGGFVGGVEDEVDLRQAELGDDATEAREGGVVVKGDAGEIDENTFFTAFEIERESAFELCADDLRIDRGLRRGIGAMGIELVNGGRLAFDEAGLSQYFAEHGGFAGAGDADEDVDRGCGVDIGGAPAVAQDFGRAGDLFADGEVLHAGKFRENLLGIRG